jgi:hypothetical protein
MAALGDRGALLASEGEQKEEFEFESDRKSKKKKNEEEDGRLLSTLYVVFERASLSSLTYS